MLTGRAHPLPVVMLAFSIALGMSGCVAPTPDPTPSTSAAPSASPLFDSDEEALAAATEAYAAYLALGTEVAGDGGLNPERMSEVTTGEAYDQELATFTSMAQSGQRGQGAQTFDSVSLQSSDLSGQNLIVYLCLDTTKTQIIDATGTVVDDPARPVRFPLQVSFLPGRGADRELIVALSESWAGVNFC